VPVGEGRVAFVTSPCVEAIPNLAHWPNEIPARQHADQCFEMIVAAVRVSADASSRSRRPDARACGIDLAAVRTIPTFAVIYLATVNSAGIEEQPALVDARGRRPLGRQGIVPLRG
jgi:hypothetical protein